MRLNAVTIFANQSPATPEVKAGAREKVSFATEFSPEDNCMNQWLQSPLYVKENKTQRY